MVDPNKLLHNGPRFTVESNGIEVPNTLSDSYETTLGQ
jgi:hypothetical protein